MAIEKRATVLVVHPAQEQQQMFRRMLQRAGFRVLLAATAKQALSKSAQLVLANVELPDTNGFAFCRKLKSNPDTSHIPVILISACFATPERIIEGIESGADDCLVPSISEMELITRVKARLRTQDVHLRRTNHLLSGQAESLRPRLERLRAALEIAQLGVWELTVQQSVWVNDESVALVWFDERCCQIFGLTEGGHLSFGQLFALIHPDDRKQFESKLHRALSRYGEGVFDLECRVEPPDGTQRWVIMRGHLMPSGPGENSPRRITGTIADVTERKQIQQALLQSEKLASAGRMVATIAHEINNPLAAVMNLLYIAKGLEGLPESARRYLEAADAELKRIAHITRQSLGFYRESSAPSLTSINGVIDSAIDLLYAKIKAKHAKIEKQYEIAAELIAVGGELRQVFANLLANSLDAIDEKGMIKVRVSNHRASYSGNSSVRVTITDNGKGIHAGVRAHVFEPFFTTKGTLGTGLGLWVSKQIIDKHNGRIRLHSCISGARRGTTVSILLPTGGANHGR